MPERNLAERVTIAYDAKTADGGHRMSSDLAPGDVLLLVERLADLGTWRFDVEAASGQMSPQALNMLGLPARPGNTIAAGEWADIYGSDKVEEARAAIAEAVHTGGIYRMELPVRMTGGGERWMLSVGKVFEGPRGPELIGFNMDVTRAKQAELERDAARLRFERCARASAVNIGAASVIHEVMQPLTVAGARLDALRLLLRREAASPELLALADTAAASVKETARVARATRRFVQEGSAEPALVDLLATIRQAVAGFTSGGTSSLAIRYDVRDHGPPLVGDASLLRQLFLNLLGNAADASSDLKPPQVDIVYRHKGGRHLVIVRDQGSTDWSVPRDALTMPFGSASPGGVGLGLWLCHAIARLHHGSLRVAPARPGTAIQIILRSLAPDETAHAVPAQA